MQILTFHLAASKSFLHWNEGHDNNLSTGLFLTIIICSRERAEALAAGRGAQGRHKVARRCWELRPGLALPSGKWRGGDKVQVEAAWPGGPSWRGGGERGTLQKGEMAFTQP